MRVISGQCRGRKLQEPAGNDVRPTTDQVKEAMFNIIQFDIEGRRVLDLFACTGQLGIEALSRGAAECVFVDSSRDSLRLVQENLKRCGLRAPTVQCEAPRIVMSSTVTFRQSHISTTWPVGPLRHSHGEPSSTPRPQMRMSFPCARMPPFTNAPALR